MNQRPTLPLKSGDEQDILTRARKRYKYTGRAGVCAEVKRQYNRRVRQNGKDFLRGIRTGSGPEQDSPQD